MYSKMAVLAASRLRKRCRLRSSVFKLATKDSEMALSKADPTLPIEGVMPTSSNLLANERAVYCAPRSVWWISQSGTGLPSPEGHLQRVHHKLSPKVAGHRPAHHLPGVAVEYEG